MPEPGPSAADDPTEPSPEAAERRRFLVTGALFLGVLAAVILAAALLSGGSDGAQGSPTSTEACPPGDEVCLGQQREGERPGIIPRPDEGRKPQDAGDPGGAGQLALLAGIVVALALIGFLIVRSSRRARREAQGPQPR